MSKSNSGSRFWQEQGKAGHGKPCRESKIDELLLRAVGSDLGPGVGELDMIYVLNRFLFMKICVMSYKLTHCFLF